MRINTKKQYWLLIVPYFELYTFFLLVNIGVLSSAIYGLISSCFSLARIMVSTYAFTKLIGRKLNGKKWYGRVWIIFAVFSISLAIASTFNRSIYFSFFIGLYNYVGFALTCEYLFEKKPGLFLESGTKLFSVLILFGIISILVFPNGFNHSPVKSSAVYFLGGKNSAVYYYLLFLLFYLTRKPYRKEKNRLFIPSLLVVMMITLAICKSSNGLFSILIFSIFYITIYHRTILRRLWRPSITIPILAVAFYLIVFANDNAVFRYVLSLFGRSSDYTGRDVLWVQAIDLFKANPIIGNGINTEYKLLSYVWQPHAHNFYLDYLAKYGIFPIIILITGIIKTLVRAWKNSKSKELSVCTAILIIILFHSIFDGIDIYYYVIILCFVEFAGKMDNANWI